MDKPKGKSGLAVLIGIGKKKAGVSESGSPSGLSDDSAAAGLDEPGAPDKERVAVDELADCMGVDDKESFFRCFKNAVAAVDADDIGGDEGEPGEDSEAV